MQEFITAVIVSGAACVVVKRYAPQFVRMAYRSGLAKIAKYLGWHWLERKISHGTATTTSCANGCGTCGGCGPSSTTSEHRIMIVSEEGIK